MLDSDSDTELSDVLSTCERHGVKHPEEKRCPACSCRGRTLDRREGSRLMVCTRCRAFFGNVTELVALSHVLLGLTMTAEASTRAFDFVMLDGSSKGRRLHGWFNEASGRVTQLG